MILKGVMTFAEAAEHWGLNPSTLRRAIRDGRLQATKSGGTWLVSYEDMVATFGNPSEEDREHKD